MKKKFFDTSVLVPPFYGDHPHHEASILVIEQLAAGEGFCAFQCLVETYSTMTRLPGKYRASAEQARLYIESLLEKLQPVALTVEEYSLALKEYATNGVVGGAIYDATTAATSSSVIANARRTCDSCGTTAPNNGVGVLALRAANLELW